MRGEPLVTLLSLRITRQYTTLDTSSPEQEAGNKATREHPQHSDDHQLQPALPVGVTGTRTGSPPTDGVLNAVPPTICNGESETAARRAHSSDSLAFTRLASGRRQARVFRNLCESREMLSVHTRRCAAGSGEVSAHG